MYNHYNLQIEIPEEPILPSRSLKATKVKKTLNTNPRKKLATKVKKTLNTNPRKKIGH